MSIDSYFFIDSNGTILYRIVGEFTPSNLILEGQHALIKEFQLPFVQQQFKSDISNANNCLKYIKALRKGDLDASGNEYENQKD